VNISSTLASLTLIVSVMLRLSGIVVQALVIARQRLYTQKVRLKLKCRPNI
jgi:hypothetical protein